MAYHVIQFKELPYADIDKYVCVSNSWIKWWDKSKEKVIVAYPVEEPSCTVQRVENNEKYSRNWKCFFAKVKYNYIDGYNETVNFIKHLNRNLKSDGAKKQQTKQKKKKNGFIEDDTSSSDSGTDESVSYDDDSSSDETVIVEPLPKPGKAAEKKRQNPPIILPPEYDPNNPRWSLKYPDSKYKGRMDLIELRPEGIKSGVYVNLIGFNKCFEISDTDNALARNLLMEIFTESALRVCSLTGKVPAGTDATKSRPGLYVHAVNALVDIVLERGPGKKYDEDCDESSIRSCLSAKLYHLRSQR